MQKSAVPMVLLSREEASTSAAAPTQSTLPLQPSGTTFTMAQEAAWLDSDHFAVGRWDGSLSIFNFTASESQGPLMAKAVNSPAHEGVQMITPLPGLNAFVSSNDEGSMIIWRSASGDWSDLADVATLTYDPTLGVANSGAVSSAAGRSFFVAGHANGRVTIWNAGTDLRAWTLMATIDVRSGHPVNPWGLSNVRGIATLPSDPSYGYVVTGSEDGNLTVVRIPDGNIMSAIVYNPSAQRGINSLAVDGLNLLVANCAVGSKDFNLWCYRLSQGSWTITNTDRVNLAINRQALQVFNFDVVWALLDGGPSYFFCSTEEGALWMGQVGENGQFSIIGHEVVTHELGSALCFQNGRLALTAYDLKEFLLSS